MLALQSLSQIPDRSLQETVFGVCGIKIVMAGVSGEDAEEFSRIFGEEEMPYTSHHRGTNSGSSTSSGGVSGESSSSNYGASTNRSHSETIVHSTRLRRIFLPYEVRSIPRFHAIIESSDAEGRRWRARLIDMTSSTVARLEQGKKRTQKPDEASNLPPLKLELLPSSTEEIEQSSSMIIRSLDSYGKPLPDDEDK